MPFNGSNTFTIVNTFVPGTTILSSAVNTNYTDIATGLSDCVTRDTQGAVTGNLVLSSTGFLQLPTGTTGQRPGSPAQGYVRFNSSTVGVETYDGTQWDLLTPTVAIPEGVLTLTSGTPVISSDVIAATSVFYTPYKGQLCPVYNGTQFLNQVFAEQTLTLVSNHLASTLYDVFAFLNSGTFTIGTGPAWTNNTAGSCTRGTGASTTQLQRLNGILTNQQSMTARNGASTFTVAANQGTYLGSIFIDGTAGQVTCHRSYGQSRKWGLWNNYWRQPVILNAGDSTSSWTYATNTIRPSNNATANSMTTFTGLAEEFCALSFTQLTAPASANVTQVNIGIGYNSTTAFTGTIVNQKWIVSSGVAQGTFTALYDAPPALGINVVTSLEDAANAQTATFSGTQPNMLLRGQWLA